MDFEKLVDEVLRKVERELKKKEKTEEKLPKILVVSRLCHQGCPVVLTEEDIGKCKVEYSAVWSHNVTLNKCQEIVIGELDNESLSKMELGIFDTEYLKLISRALMEGKKIYLPEEEIEFLQYKRTAPRSFIETFRLKLRTLKKWGIIVKPKEEILMELRAKYEKFDEISSLERKNLIMKKIVTQRDVSEAYEQGFKELFLRRDAIVTDIAKEYIKKKSIVIRKDSDEGKR